MGNAMTSECSKKNAGAEVCHSILYTKVAPSAAMFVILSSATPPFHGFPLCPSIHRGAIVAGAAFPPQAQPIVIPIGNDNPLHIYRALLRSLRLPGIFSKLWREGLTLDGEGGDAEGGGAGSCHAQAEPTACEAGGASAQSDGASGSCGKDGSHFASVWLETNAGASACDDMVWPTRVVNMLEERRQHSRTSCGR